MVNGVVKNFLSNYFRHLLLLIPLLIACIGAFTSSRDLTIMKNMPLASYIRQIAQNIVKEFSFIILQPSLLTVLLIPLGFLIYYKIIGKSGKSVNSSKYYKPKKVSKVSNPNEKTAKIVALAPQSYFSELIEKLYKEISDLYGDVPLWVRYNIGVLSNSWSLNSVKASHNIRAYGENIYVQKFIARLNEELQMLIKNAPSNMAHIYSVEITPLSSNENKENNVEQIYPKEVKNLVLKDDSASFFSSLGLLSAIILAMFVNDLWRKRRFSTNVNENLVGKMEAMQNALKVIKKLDGNTQELERIENYKDGWIFKFTNYEVSVNRSGFITHIRRHN